MSPEGPGETMEAAPFEATPRTPEDERLFGLMLFEAEEILARGGADKALVLASRAVKERPDSLTARALMDRARRELLRGKRREKLESRLKEAEAALSKGDLKGAEKVILSALKVVPDHPMAQELFKHLKEARAAQGTVEAEAERELQRLAQAEVKRAVDAARAARGAGWEAKALLSIRRGLRVVPDAPELLGLLSETQAAAEGHEEERARRHALVSQVRAGLELLRRGQIGESLKILRAVLDEDPDNARAQSAIQEVRRVWLARSQAPHSLAAPVQPASGTPARVLRGVLDVPDTVVLPRPEATAPAVLPRVPRPAAEPRGIPGEIRLPRTLQRATPVSVVVAGALVAVGVILVLGRSGGPPPPPAAQAPAPSTDAVPRVVPVRTPDPGPLVGVDPDLRRAIEETVATYTKAIESRSGDLLAKARPDLGAEERASLLTPFKNALSVQTDVRVLDVALRADGADVEVLRKDTIVGGTRRVPEPAEETLRFDKRKGVWALRGRKEHR
jgi:tetratricopeptide (TPR) repeat protein